VALREPRYLDVRGLASVPRDVDARRFIARDGANLVAIDNWMGDAPATFVNAASASRRILEMHGARSIAHSGAHRCWITCPLAASNVFWKPLGIRRGEPSQDQRHCRRARGGRDHQAPALLAGEGRAHPVGAKPSRESRSACTCQAARVARLASTDWPATRAPEPAPEGSPFSTTPAPGEWGNAASLAPLREVSNPGLRVQGLPRRCPPRPPCPARASPGRGRVMELVAI
jgi:hypothetical protein